MVRLFILHRAGQEPWCDEALNRAFCRFGYALSPGILYPLLHILERQRLLRCHIRIAKGRVRKYYELTEEGRFWPWRGAQETRWAGGGSGV